MGEELVSEGESFSVLLLLLILLRLLFLGDYCWRLLIDELLLLVRDVDEWLIVEDVYFAVGFVVVDGEDEGSGLLEHNGLNDGDYSW